MQFNCAVLTCIKKDEILILAIKYSSGSSKTQFGAFTKEKLVIFMGSLQKRRGYKLGDKHKIFS
jgi:hypothetical protein